MVSRIKRSGMGDTLMPDGLVRSTSLSVRYKKGNVKRIVKKFFAIKI